MLLAEAKWLGEALREFPVARLSPLLNVGAGTEEFRRLQQPWIDEYVFGPLMARGCRVVHLDAKADSGAQVIGDVLDSEVLAAAARLGPRALICSNVVEHVTRPHALMERLPAILPVGGVLFVTAPYEQPLHDDPIDNGLRPTPLELASMLPGCSVRRADVVRCHTWAWYLSRRPQVMLRALARLALPVWRPRRWWGLARVVPWLVKPFGASCVVLEKV